MEIKLFGYIINASLDRYKGLSVSWRKPMWSVKLKDRCILLGFDSGDKIAPGATRRVKSNPQDTFAPNAITIPKHIAKHFDIIDILIGAVSQFSSADPIPASTFSSDTPTRDVNFDVAQISQEVTFVVKNNSTKGRRFQASIRGFVVRT